MKNLGHFLEVFPADANRAVASDELVAHFEGRVPRDLTALWKTQGLGAFADGFLHFFDPRQFLESFSRWLPNADGSRFPFCRNAFGEFYYWRDLSGRAAANGLGDISFLDVTHSTSNVMAYIFDLFLDVMTKDKTSQEWRSLYQEARTKLPAPSDTEMHCFVPSLRMGGKKAVNNLELGDAKVHLQFLRDSIG